MAVAAFGVKFTTPRSDRSTNNKQVTQEPALTTYQNAQYGFSFSYPTDWRLTKLNGDNTVLNFDAADNSRMTVYALDYSGTGISALLEKKEEKTIKISGIDSTEQIWVWNQQAPKASQIGLMTNSAFDKSVKQPLATGDNMDRDFDLVDSAEDLDFLRGLYPSPFRSNKNLFEFTLNVEIN